MQRKPDIREEKGKMGQNEPLGKACDLDSEDHSLDPSSVLYQLCDLLQ